MGYIEDAELAKNPLTIQEVLNGAIGYGAERKYMTDASAIDTTNTFFALQIISDTVFSSLTDEDEEGTGLTSLFIGSVTFAAGMVIYGKFSDVELDSGALIGYIKK